MYRFALAIPLVLSLAACDAGVKTFSDATSNVNEGYAMGKRLRDRCNATQNIDHCKAWLDHKRAAEAENALLDYDKGLARWEAKGPY